MDDERLTAQTDANGDSDVASDESVSQVIKAEDRSTIRDVIQAVVSGQVTGDVHIGDKVYTRSSLGELNDYLARAVSVFEARMYQLVARPPAPPDQPYKFLYAFEIEDADIFFGRDAASEALYQTVLKDRLTVLHAKSGAGKTSLLNAGLSPRLIREGRLPVYARAYEDPVRAVKRAVAPPSLGPWPELLSQLTLHEFLGLACAHLSRQTQELVVVLDQFEEFFIFWPERAHRQPFIDALADCYDDKTFPMRLIIALRKDYYSDLATFQDRLPHIFHNEYFLGAMSRDEAQAAVTGPVAKLGRPVDYEPILLDTLLDDLAGGGPALSPRPYGPRTEGVAEGMELPHLQIVCTQLYEALDKGETTITLDSYEKLGQVEGVLGGYLNDVLNRLPDQGGTIAKEVLKELVSSEATRRVLSNDRLAARVEAQRNELQAVLARLVAARLLHRDEIASETTYEIAHEYLIGEIEKWIDESDLAFKQAEELLAREVANWRVHGTLIPRDRLEKLHPHRERFQLEGETLDLLLLSTLEADFAVVDWAAIAGEGGQEVLQAALKDGRQKIRLAALRSLGAVWGVPQVSELGNYNQERRREAAEALGRIGDARVVEPLIAALGDEDRVVRGMAAVALRLLGEPAVEPLIAALRDKASDVRRWAAWALEQIGDARAVEPFVAALRDADSGVHESAAKALEQLGEPAVEPLIATLRDAHRAARWRAAGALGKIGDARAVEPLIAALRDEYGFVRRDAAGALGWIGDARAMEPLIAALRDEASDVRKRAARALGQIGDACAVKPLIAALRDESWSVRESAAGALGQIGDTHAVEPLIAALRDEYGFVRRDAAEALGKIGDAHAVEPLIAAQEDERSHVRERAARALGQIGDARAVEPLIAALRDEDSGVRWRAAEALGQIGDARAMEPLSAALRDRAKDRWGKYRVQEAAAEALKKIGTPEALAVLEE